MATPPTWHLATLPPLRPTNMLWSVAAVDATHAWAVGAEAYSPERPDTSGSPVVQRWDGSRWLRETLPVMNWRGALRLVAAGSPTDVWAVGSSTGPDPTDTVTHVVRYDGAGWREVPFPPGNNPSIMQITGLAVADGHAWLVGNKLSETVIQEWDGQTWRTHQAPAECRQRGTSFGGMPTFCTFDAVTAFAPNDVWAAGNGAWAGFQGPLLFHWNGTSWKPVKVGLNRQQFTFSAITGRSPADIWAVGNLFNSGTPLAVHGDGTSWTVVEGLPDGELTGVAQDAEGRPWAIVNSPAPESTLTRYDGGSSWIETTAPTPSGTVGVGLAAITAVPGSSTMFAVGYADLPTNPTTVTAVIEEYSSPDSASPDSASPGPLP